MTPYPVTNFHKPTKHAILGLLVGPQIGDGAHRRVYEMPGRPNEVLKLERNGGEFMNIAEWRAWDELRWESRTRKWLAPCTEISPCGDALIQTRCRDLTDDEWNCLHRVPAWLGDTKRENWGWLEDEEEKLGGRPVMRDYALNRLADRGSRGALMREVLR